MFYELFVSLIVVTWQSTNAWKREDIWITDDFDSSANPVMIIFTWSAIWHETSWDNGRHGLFCIVEYESDPIKIHDNNRMWLRQSEKSLQLYKNSLKYIHTSYTVNKKYLKTTGILLNIQDGVNLVYNNLKVNLTFKFIMKSQNYIFII